MRGPQVERLAVIGQAVDDSVEVFKGVTSPLWTWWDSEAASARFARRTLPVLAISAIGVWYFAVFMKLSWLRHENLGSFDYDLGMYDQGIWQLAHGRGFMTVRGMHVFAHHANIGYLLLTPFYRLGAGPHFLNFLNVAGVTAVAIPVYFLGRRHLRSQWAGAFLAGLYLFHFSPQWKIQETFHAESLAAPFLVSAFYFASVGKWRAYGWCLVAAIIWKEDTAIAVAMMGVIVALLFGRWRTGLLTLAAGTAYFLVATKWFMPHYQVNGAVYDGLFGPLGQDAGDVARTMITDPTRVGGVLREHNADREAVRLAIPGALSAVGSPAALLLGLPQHVINFATTAYFTWDLRWHYAFYPYLGVLLAGVRTVTMRARTLTVWALIAAMVVCTVWTRESGVGCWTVNGNVGNFPYAAKPDAEQGNCSYVLFGGDQLTNIPSAAEFKEAMSKIPDDAVVSTTYYGVPHLSHRQFVYTFPNPWISSNYGVGGRPSPPDPATVEYLLLRREALNPSEKSLFDGIVASGDYDRVFGQGDLFLLKRRNPVAPSAPDS